MSNRPGERLKRARAEEILRRADCCLSVQVLSEFFAQATRPSRPDPLTTDMAIGFVQVWARFHVQDNTIGILHAALGLKVRHGFSYWDSAIIAAAAALGCRELLTEDMSHGQVVDGVTILNPFL